MLLKFSVMIETRASLPAGTLAGVPGPRPPGWPLSCGAAVAARPCANAVLPKAAAAAAPVVPARKMRRFIPLLPRDPSTRFDVVEGEITIRQNGIVNQCARECGRKS